jgi:hypothetical protein
MTICSEITYLTNDLFHSYVYQSVILSHLSFSGAIKRGLIENPLASSIFFTAIKLHG